MMNETLQTLRELAVGPAGLERHAALVGLLSSSTPAPWGDVVIDYIRQHELMRPEDGPRLKLQFEAAQARRTWRNPTDGSEMVWIPPGPFWYGSLASLPKHSRKYPTEIALEGFSMARHPVTNAQYARFVEATGYRSPLRVRWDLDSFEMPDDTGEFDAHNTSYLKHWDWSEDGENASYPPELAEHPVVYVSWFDAQMYCRWAGLCLPSRYMWEKAARGTDKREFPWGDQPMGKRTPKLAHIWEPGTCSVHAYARTRTGFGCANMLGNVSEICELYEQECLLREDGTLLSHMPLVRPNISFARLFQRWMPHRGCNYGGFVDANNKESRALSWRISQDASNSVARHVPYTGFRPAYLPTLSPPEGDGEIDFEGFLVEAAERCSQSETDEYGYAMGSGWEAGFPRILNHYALAQFLSDGEIPF